MTPPPLLPLRMPAKSTPSLRPFTTAAAKEAQANNDILVGVTALDDYTLEVKLVAPCPYFIDLCAFPTFFPGPAGFC